MPQIKFSFIVKEWIFYVFLQNKCPEFTISISFSTFKSDQDIVDIITYCNAFTSISVLPRFYDPNISYILFYLFLFLKSCIRVEKFRKFGVLDSLSDMKSKREYVEWIFFLEFKVSL